MSNFENKFRTATLEELEEAETCIICRDKLYEGCVKLPCGHIFHVDCLKSWLLMQQCCPTCRGDIPAEPKALPKEEEKEKKVPEKAEEPKAVPTNEASSSSAAPADKPKADAEASKKTQSAGVSAEAKKDPAVPEENAPRISARCMRVGGLFDVSPEDFVAQLKVAQDRERDTTLRHIVETMDHCKAHISILASMQNFWLYEQMKAANPSLNQQPNPFVPSTFMGSSSSAFGPVAESGLASAHASMMFGAPQGPANPFERLDVGADVFKNLAAAAKNPASSTSESAENAPEEAKRREMEDLRELQQRRWQEAKSSDSEP